MVSSPSDGSGSLSIGSSISSPTRDSLRVLSTGDDGACDVAGSGSGSNWGPVRGLGESGGSWAGDAGFVRRGLVRVLQLASTRDATASVYRFDVPIALPFRMYRFASDSNVL